MTIISIYAHGIEASKYMKQILKGVKGKINSNTVIAGDFNILLFQQWIGHPAENPYGEQ